MTLIPQFDKSLSESWLLFIPLPIQMKQPYLHQSILVCPPYHHLFVLAKDLLKFCVNIQPISRR